MNKLQRLLIPILLVNPFYMYIRNTLNEYYSLDSYIKIVENNIDRDFSIKNIMGQVVSLNTKATKNNDKKLEDNELKFINLKDHLFPKTGTTYTQRTQHGRTGSISKRTKILTFKI